MDSASLEDLALHHQGAGREANGELDLNDELQLMQDLTCFNVYRRRHKKGRKYKEWKKDVNEWRIFWPVTEGLPCGDNYVGAGAQKPLQFGSMIEKRMFQATGLHDSVLE